MAEETSGFGYPTIRLGMRRAKRIATALYDGQMPASKKGAAEQNAEAVRIQRLREDARRPLSINLKEGIALSHAMLRIAGSARGN